MNAVILELELASEQYDQLSDVAAERREAVEKVAQIAVIEWLEQQGHSQNGQDTDPDEPQLEIIHLQGLLKGLEFSSEEIAEARRELWGGFGERNL
jgi:hypothetical protein